MKRIFAAVLCIALTILLFTACGKSDDNMPLFTAVDQSSRKEVTASFKNTDSGETLDVKLKKKDSSDNTAQFTGNADPATFDRVTVNADGTETIELAYNDYVKAWDLSSGRPYPGTEAMEPQYDRIAFDYEDRKKDVLIWTPEDDNASSDDKYSVIYMTDGQNLFDRKATATGSWGVAESVVNMMANGGQKCIIVGIENGATWRDEELTPDLGKVTQASYEGGKGKYFSDFVVDKVMPYVNEHYNVYTDRAHTHIAGSSSGGIESFYIAMEHPDKFASVGALSPAFLLYTDDTWVDYLNKKDFSKNAPLVYLYCGNGSGDQLEQALCTGTKTMPNNLKACNYPKDKVIIKLYENGVHNEMYWRAVFPDYLQYAFPKAS